MNWTSLVLALVFAGIAIPFFGQANKAGDPVQARNKRLAGALFLVPAVGFLMSFLVSAFAR